MVTYIHVARPFGESAIVPWEKIGSLSSKEITLTVDNIASFAGAPDDNAVLLKDHILDKKAIDMDGQEMEVIYDIKLTLKNDKLYVSDVDLSRYGLLRRMGLTGLANYIYSLAERVREQTISWTYIQPLPEEMSAWVT